MPETILNTLLMKQVEKLAHKCAFVSESPRKFVMTWATYHALKKYYETTEIPIIRDQFHTTTLFGIPICIDSDAVDNFIIEIYY